MTVSVHFSQPVLSSPNFALLFKLEVDASAVGAGAVLLQEDGSGIDHPVCYFSKKFIAAQRNYSTIVPWSAILVVGVLIQLNFSSMLFV